MISPATTNISIAAATGIAIVVVICRTVAALKLGRAAIEKAPAGDLAKALGAAKALVDAIRTCR